MDYEKATDNQINFRLSELLNEGGELKAAANYEEYCSNWNQTGPLIAEHKISLLWEYGEPNQWMAGAGDYIEWTSVGMHQNPLRAAAICLIKLLEAKQ